MLENIFDNRSKPCPVEIIFIVGDLLINAIVFIKKMQMRKLDTSTER